MTRLQSVGHAVGCAFLTLLAFIIVVVLEASSAVCGEERVRQFINAVRRKLKEFAEDE